MSMEKRILNWINSFDVLQKKCIKGEMWINVKDSNGVYGWYKLVPEEYSAEDMK